MLFMNPDWRTATIVLLVAVTSTPAIAASSAWLQEQTLLPFATQTNARFGSAVAVNGDVAAVGMPLGDFESITNSGIVYIWRRTNTGWSLANGVVSSGQQASAFFGSSVAIDADHLYVGSPMFDPPASGGLVEEFVYDGTTWNFDAGIGGATGDRNGSAIAEDHGLIALGNPGPCETCGVQGRAGKVQINYAFSSVATYSTLYGPAGDEEENFGASVAVYRSPLPAQPDLLAVGAPHHHVDGVGDQAGAVYVYTNTTHVAHGWVLVATLTPDMPVAGDLFGRSVAIGPGRVIVGAPDRDRPGSTPIADTGAVFVFVPDGVGGWEQQAQVFLPDPAAGELFGSTVAYDAAHGRVFASAPQRQHTVFGGSGATGSVAVLERKLVLLPNIFGWVTTNELYSLDQPTIGQQTGQSLALSGDRVFVGAPGYDANANAGITASGRVLVFVADEIFDDGFD